MTKNNQFSTLGSDFVANNYVGLARYLITHKFRNQNCRKLSWNLVSTMSAATEIFLKQAGLGIRNVRRTGAKDTGRQPDHTTAYV
jgi:hypothetical protein